MVTGLTGHKTLTVLYDRDCGICTAVSRALVRLDSAGRLAFEPLDRWTAAGGPSREELTRVLHAYDELGRWFTGGRATVEICRRIPSLWPVALVARLPGAPIVFEVGYRLIADHRHRLSALLGLEACPVPRRSNQESSA